MLAESISYRGYLMQQYFVASDSSLSVSRRQTQHFSVALPTPDIEWVLPRHREGNRGNWIGSGQPNRLIGAEQFRYPRSTQLDFSGVDGHQSPAIALAPG